jgi:hypothetical protein
LPGFIEPEERQTAKAAKAKPNPCNKKLYDDGMKVRKAVLGADYVDNSLADADDFMSRRAGSILSAVSMTGFPVGAQLASKGLNTPVSIPSR